MCPIAAESKNSKSRSKKKLNKNITPSTETEFSNNTVEKVVNNDNELESRKLSILKKYSDFGIVKDGLKAGERIVISKLSTASNGIKVNPVYK